MALKCYRKPGETGPHVFYARLEDNTTYQIGGEDAKFNFQEAVAIEAGADPKELIAKRPAKYHVPQQVPSEEPERFSPARRGRPPKEG